MIKKRCPRCKINERATYGEGKFQTYCKSCMNDDARKWYWNNREKKIKLVQDKQKATNYAYQKTETQKLLRKIRGETARKYPLEGKFCKFCPSSATERHHNTFPIEVHKFDYACHDCHQVQNTIRREEIKKIKNGKY